MLKAYPPFNLAMNRRKDIVPMRADLHIHTTASDGWLSPREVVLLAKSLKVDIIAVSDHNSVDGIAEASEAGRQYGVSVIPAVELSTRFNNESIHMLGYFRYTRFGSAEFKQILESVRNHRAFEVRRLLGGFRKHSTLNNYLSSPEGIHMLKAYGAAVVLAHPIRITGRNLTELLNMPFDGIEAKYCSCNDYYTNHFISLAKNRFSFYTGGSDFHTNTSAVDKHCTIGDPSLNLAEIQSFLQNSGALVLGTRNNCFQSS